MENPKFIKLFHTVFFESERKVSETASIFRFKFSRTGELSHFPGQYVWLVLDSLAFPDSRGERRAFSIISLASEPDFVEFLVRESDSGYKKTLHTLKRGDKASIIGPFGHSFVIPKDNTSDITLVVGGVAVAAFFAIINSLNAKPGYKLRLVHFISDDDKNLNVSELLPKCAELGISVTDVVGRFNGLKIPGTVNYGKELFFVAGPQGFVNDVNTFLISKKVPAEHLFFEENYPEPEGNLTEEDFTEQKGRQGILLHAIRDSKSHTVITDANGKIVFANPVAEKNTGYSFAEMRGGTARLWGGLMPLQFYKDFWKSKHQIGGFDGEIMNRRKNGEIYTVIAHISPIADEKGTVVGYIGTEEDITLTKKQSETVKQQNIKLYKKGAAMLNILEDLQIEKQHLAESKAKDDAMLASIGDGLIAVDKDGKIVLVNKSFEKLLGWSGAEVLGKTVYELGIALDKDEKIIPEDKLAINKILTTTTTTTTTVSSENYKRKDGSIFPASTTFAPIIIDGAIIGAVEVFRDITKEHEVDKAKTEFVSLASHQLRTPLTPIRLFSEMLLNNEVGKLSKPQKEYVETILKSVIRMISLVNDLLNVSHLETGRLTIAPVSIDIISFIQEIISEILPTAEAKGSKIIFEPPKEKLAKINIDPVLVRQVVHNLLTNAIRYTVAKVSKITVNVILDEADNYVISVHDSGIGIPVEAQNRIFEKMFRADNARVVEAEGSGLGMYMSKKIVEASGGGIWFESPPKGEKTGTIFYVSIPQTGMIRNKGERTLLETKIEV